MSALHKVELKDPRWYQELVQDPEELLSLVGGKETGTFAVCKQDKAYFLVHKADLDQPAVVEALPVDGCDFDEIRRIHHCSKPYFESLVKERRLRDIQIPSYTRPSKKRRSDKAHVQEQEVKKWRSYRRIIQEFENSDWYFPDLSEDQILQELKIAPVGIFLISRNEHQGYRLYWKQRYDSEEQIQTIGGDLMFDSNRIYLKGMDGLAFDSFDSLKGHFQLDLPFSKWQQELAERQAGYQAMEVEAAL